MSFFFLICLAIFHPCLLTRRHVWQFPMNHLRKANNNLSDGLTNLKWVIFLRKQRMFDASFRPRAWCFWFGCKWCGVVLLVGQDSVYEREDMWGERAKERTLGRGCFQAAFNCAPQAPFPRQGKPTTHCSLVAAAQTFCLDGWRDRGGANHYCCFNWCIAIFPHFYSPLILCLRPSHPSGRTFHLNISSFLLFLWELSLLFLLYDKIKVREWDYLSLASKASLEIFTRWE